MYENPEAAINYLLNLDEEAFFDVFILKGNSLNEYNKQLSNFKHVNGNKNISTKEKGKSLEDIVLFIAQQTNLFTIGTNIKNSSNEMDLLLFPKVQTKKLLSHFLEENLTDLICECKNYSSKVSVTWVGKLYSLLKYQRCAVGIIFSYHGFTGQNWQDAVGLSKKIYLSDGTMIIDFNINDFESLANGKSILSIIKHKISNLKHDTKIEYDSHSIEEIYSADELYEMRNN